MGRKEATGFQVVVWGWLEYEEETCCRDSWLSMAPPLKPPRLLSKASISLASFVRKSLSIIIIIEDEASIRMSGPVRNFCSSSTFFALGAAVVTGAGVVVVVVVVVTGLNLGRGALVVDGSK